MNDNDSFRLLDRDDAVALFLLALFVVALFLPS